MNYSELTGLLSSWASEELKVNILPFWKNHSRDFSTGGFYGHLDNYNCGDKNESRSVVMTSRHLWAYSAASRLLKDRSYLEMADYAYKAIMKNFIDFECGGVYWSVKPDGSPDVSKKQIYGEAFTIYAFSEYASTLIALRSAQNKISFLQNSKEFSDAGAVLETALGIYYLLETYARDKETGGYIEALSREWKKTTDLKLSDKDIDCDKSMNTNLHIMEAFTCLHRALLIIKPEAKEIISRVEESLGSLIIVTVDKILGPDAHLDLYFNKDWSSIKDIISYGHDIEASWLLWEAGEELGNPDVLEKIRPRVIRIAEIALAEGFDAVTGGMENEFHNNHKDLTRIWWCQAEALVGFYNAWQMTADKKFLLAAVGISKWIEKFQKDSVNGDWFWAVNPKGLPDLSQPKGGNWKTSYHNARCCMEIINRSQIV